MYVYDIITITNVTLESLEQKWIPPFEWDVCLSRSALEELCHSGNDQLRWKHRKQAIGLRVKNPAIQEQKASQRQVLLLMMVV